VISDSEIAIEWQIWTQDKNAGADLPRRCGVTVESIGMRDGYAS